MELTRTFHPRLPTDLARTLGDLWRGTRDRSMWIAPDPRIGVWRATRTPEGPGTQWIRPAGACAVTGADGRLGARDDIVVTAWGPGRHWLIERAPRLVGGDDSMDGFVVPSPLRETARRFVGLRMPRTDAVFEALLPVVLEQKVTGGEARDAYAALQQRLCEPAPGPSPPGRPPLLLPPEPQVVADTPSHVFHAAGVERKRSDALRRASIVASRLEECAQLEDPIEGRELLHRRVNSIAGLGPWTAAKVAHVALGDADAVAVGDFHLKNWVSWALAREPRGTDERMLELLAPYVPHRGRVVALINASGVGAPRFGPRLTPQRRW